VDEPILDAYTSDLLQSAFVLRGYEPGQFGGNQMVLSNAEYRFPIAYVDRGLSTLPVFVSAVSGAVFADFGGAFNRLNYDEPESDLHLGTGAELWLELTLGYTVTNTLRFGAARGFGPAAPGLMKYFVAAGRF
jgi:outer membrane protein assembly factor BamA